MAKISLYGPNWSSYTRTVRLALIEKEVEYELVEVDFSGGMPEEQFERHPFGKVPVLEHGGFWIYETSAICRYIDLAFDGSSLQPSDPKKQGRMAQIIAMLDAYLSKAIRMGLVNERLIKPMTGMKADKVVEQNSEVAIAKGLHALGECADKGAFLVGDHISLADLHAAPLFDYLDRTPGGNKLVQTHSRLTNWWGQMKQRPSVVSTSPDLSVFESIGRGSR